MLKLFKKIISTPKTPEQIQKELSEKAMAKKISVTESDMEYIEDPLFTARINFETFKSIFKRNKIISGSDKNKGYINSENMKIIRLRETDSTGSVTKSLETIRLKKSSEAIRYMEMANRSYGMTSYTDGKYVYFAYDIKTIENDIEKNEHKKK